MDGSRRWWALGAVSLSVLAIGLDGTVLSVGLAGDRFGRKKVMLGSLAGSLAGFVLWEGRLGRLPGGRPLIDPALFGSASFLRGAVLAAVAGLAMIGVLFQVPQFFQDVQGADTLGSGLRLLPLIAGMVLGAGLAGRLAQGLGARAAVVLGFVVLAAGLATGATTGVGSGSAIVATWTAVVGAGTGLALSAATTAALCGLGVDRSGTESAVVQAFNKASGPLGAAVTGSVLVAVYQARVDTTGLTPATAEAAHRSLTDGLAVARALGSPALQDSGKAAFVAGMNTALLVSAVIAAVGAVAAAVLLPGGRSAHPRSRKGPVDAVP